jgi:acetyl-CoA carboxylase, biotin carboxylase subunit
MKKAIRKLLIANRGEIASRIIKTAREMGIHTVAVYSEADITAPFVRLADEAHLIGPAASIDSYLRKDKIIDVAKKTGTEAIHPGYGFLSENAEFAEMVGKHGIIFVGPAPESMRRMGDKTSARKLAKSLQVPMVEGIVDTVDSLEDIYKTVEKIGYPILIKASAGGGGKGMRIVRSSADLESSYRMARSEAKSAFNDDRVYIEKYLENPRHIEVQILADQHGNVVHLGERECSIQRRHQKIIEESPSPVVDEVLRSKMTESAVRLARASNYVSAGTLEFLVDKDKNFYFLEMNTRLQVEHPVTEMRTGLDLVKEQILIAEGKNLSFRQEEIQFRGAAIECRLYAENSLNSFFPSTGVIKRLEANHGVQTREDSGIELGSEVTTYYDPLLSKLIAWGNSRGEALDRMSRLLGDYKIYGLRTNLDICSWIVNHPEFRNGNFSTNFIPQYFSLDVLAKPTDEEIQIASIVALLQDRKLASQKTINTNGNGQSPSRWKQKRFSAEP